MYVTSSGRGHRHSLSVFADSSLLAFILFLLDDGVVRLNQWPGEGCKAGR
jgi:hypothetical protein